MTRRKFIQKLAGAGSVTFIGIWWLIKKAAPRKFILAVRTSWYPGSVRPLQDIDKQAKWSG